MKTDHWDIPFRYLIFIIILILLAALAWTIRELFQPLLTAALLAWILSPLINLLSEKTKLSRKASANIIFFAALAIMIALPIYVVPVLVGELKNISTALNTAVEQIRIALEHPIIVGTFQLEFGTLVPAFQSTLTSVISLVPEDALHLLESTSRGVAWFLLILVSTYYLMTDWDKTYTWLIEMFPVSYRGDAEKIYADIKEVWAAYLRGQILLMIIVGIVFSIVWAAIGLPGALIIGILTGLLSLVPEIGPLTATIIAVIVALLEGSTYLPLTNFWFAVLVVAIYAVLINFKNIWLRPYIMGRSVNIHEGIIFVAILAAVIFQGVLGALIIVPVLASFIIIGRYIRRRLLGLAPFISEAGDEPILSEPVTRPRRRLKLKRDN